MLVLALLAAYDAGEERGLPEAERIASAIFERNPKELSSVIPLSRVREAFAQVWKKAGDAEQSRQSLNAARKLWDEFPDQNEFVRRRQAELREKIVAK